MKYSNILTTFFLLLGCCVTSTEATPASGYYAGVDNLAGAPLKSALRNIVTNHTVYSYANAYDALEDIDEDPDNTDNILTQYSNLSIVKTNRGVSTAGYWNREHCWPKSLGSAEGTPMYTDLHHLFAEEFMMNTYRSNSIFANVLNPTQEAYGCKWTSDAFEPRDDAKGDVARALFYMELVYEPDYGFTLINTANPSTGQMAHKNTLIAWSSEDPISEREELRNDRVYEKQDNRNPFIDIPDLVARVYDQTTTGGSVMIVYDNLSTDTLTVGSKDNSFVNIDITMTTGTDWNFGQLRLQVPDSVVKNDLSTLSLYADLDHDRVIDSTDLLLSQTLVEDSTILFDIPETVRATANTTLSLILALNISDAATSGNLVSLYFPDNAISADSTHITSTEPVVEAYASETSVIAGEPPAATPAVVINKYQNKSSNKDELIELLITKDNTSLAGLWIKDFSSNGGSDNGGKHQFGDVDKWKNLKAGTLIVLIVNGTPQPETEHVLTASMYDTTLFPTRSGTFDIARKDIVMIKSGTAAGTDNSICAIGSVDATAQFWTSITTGYKARTPTSIGSETILYVTNTNSAITDYNDDSQLSTSTTTSPEFGKPNTDTNAEFINTLLPVSLSEFTLE